jgi:hypothetical protein
VFGNNRAKLITICCRCCRRWHVVRVDPEDLEHHVSDGVFVQFAFPYLDSGDRELVLTATCPACWAVLCASDPLAYS